jgi:hypothetical protein
MSKKFYLLICVVFVLALANGAAAQDVRSWWSDLGPTNDWDEPNNWWTVEWPNNVKAANSVPDINTQAYIGKGGGWQDYPAELNDLIVGGHIMVDPTIDGTIVAEVNYGDPCADHYLTVTGGTLTVGANQDWEGDDYERRTDWFEWGMFNGQWASGRIAIGACLSGDVNGTGTMTMSGGVVNVGGHIEVGAWGSVGLLDMTGGEMNVFQGVYCTSSWGGETGQINLHGGTINARYLEMTDNPYGWNTGIIDVTGGEMILNRNQEDTLHYYEDYANVGLYGNAISITSYGAGHGEIITDTNYAEVGKRAALVIDYDVTREGKTTLAAATPTDPCQAWGPSPADGAGNVKGPPSSLQRPVLSWSDGNDANTHDVYFGTSFAEVDGADNTDTTGIYIGNQNLGDVNWPVDRDLAIAETYFWRIDEVNTVTVKGQVWDFTVANLGKASYPSPSNEADEVPTDVTLGWTSGIYATSHDVYLGTSFDDVNDATTSVDPNGVWMGNQVGNTFDVCDYDPNALVFSTTYYWRIDERDGGTYKGDVWSFTTDSHLIVEDFDSYANETQMYVVWDDWSTNASGSELYVETGGVIVRDGNSLMYKYDSTDKNGATCVGSIIDTDTTRLGIGSDWTISDARALVLWFYGDAGNNPNSTSQLYLQLEDTSSNSGVVLYDDMSDLLEGSWHEWNIDLAIFDACGVSLTNIDQIHIGFGGEIAGGDCDTKTGGTGTVWFDDIQIWPQRCVPALSLGYGDFTGNCVIDAYDVEQIALDWLESDSEGIASAPTYDPLVWYSFEDGAGQVADNSGTSDANHDGQIGALPVVDGCDPNWVTTDPCADRLKNLEFDGIDDHVVIPILDLNSNTATITAWVKRDGDQSPWSGIVFCRGPNTLNDQWASTVSGIGFGGESKTATVHDLRYHWDDWWWWEETGLTIPDGQWTFAGLVISPDEATVYKSDGATLEYYSNVTYHGADAWDANAFVGGDPQRLSPAPGTLHRMVKGRIDDVRIYDSSLTVNEIMGIAGVPGVIYFPLDEPTNLVVRVPDPAVDANYYPSNPDIVNFDDYDVMADNWLKEYLFP